MNHAVSFPAPGLYDVKIYTQNDCGWSTNYWPLIFFCSTSGGMFSVFPNPANESLTISIDPDGAQAERSRGQVGVDVDHFSVILYDNSGRGIRKAESKDGKAVRFDTAGLPDGTYFIHIHHGEKVEKRQVAIRH